MRRFKTLTLSLLTVLLGVTAWAQVTRNAEKAPRAVGDVKIESADPASGSRIDELYEIDVLFNTDIAWVNDGDYTVGEVLNSNGESVATLDSGWGNNGWNNVKLISRPAISDDGVYTVVIFENMFGEDLYGTGASRSKVNDRIELTYIVGNGGGTPVEGTRPTWVKTTPSVPVAELSTIEVTFDQPVEISMGAMMIPFGVFEEADIFSAVTRAYVSMKEGDDTTIVFTLSEPQTATGTYSIDLEEGVVYPKGNPSEELVNEFFTVYASVAGGGSGDDSRYAKFELEAPTGDTIEDETFGAISFMVNAKSKINSAIVPYLRDENNQPWELEVLDMIDMAKAVVLRADNVTISGIYTLYVPAGFITEADGTPSKEFTKTWTYTNPYGGGGDIIPLEILAATLVNNETGETLNLLDPETKVAQFSDGWTLHVTPNNFDEIEEINLAISHEGIDEYGNEGIVYDKRVEMYSGNGCKKDSEFVLAIAGDKELVEGTTYTLTFDAENTHIAPDLRKDYGIVTTTIQGGAGAYPYSPAHLVSVIPEVDTEIFNPNQEFTLTFSQPVDVTVSFNEGMGASSKVSDVRCNEDRTIWYFTLGASRIEKETAQLDVIVKAVDLDGKVLDGIYNGNGISIKDKSVYALSWECHLGCPAVNVTPASGTVESIFSFSADANGKGIALGSSLDAPYLTTASGAVVATVDMSSEVKYGADGQPMVGEVASDAISTKVTFNLDKEITAPGKYVLVCPFAAFSLGTQFDGASSRPMQIEYLIEGTPEYDRVSIADGAEVSELSYVVAYVNADVELAEDARMQLRSDEGVLANAELIQAVKNGVTMLIADFSNNDNQPLALEAGVEYTLRIAANSVMLAGTDMSYPVLNVNITGAADVVAPVVKLTQNIASSATTVSSVAAGSKVAVNLTPAEGWKVEKVLFNNSDVTAQVVSNTYNTPALEADAVLDVIFAYDGTLFNASIGTELITDFKLFVGSEKGEIVVKNLTSGMLVNVFTVEGAHMGTYTVADMDVLNISVPAGIYVVTVTLDGKTQAVKVVNK